MKKDTLPILIKFGKKEHLEQLKNGIVHFSTLETFQEDPTTFRGDSMEGRLRLDPSKPFLINGKDISPYIQRGETSYELDCPLLSFSASMLSMDNCHQEPNGLYTINKNFVKEMKQFGDHFLIFNAFAFIDALIAEFSKTQCNYEFQPMTYLDKNNHPLIQNHFAKMSEERREFGYLFLKDTANSYSLQNEWRFVVFDIHSQYCKRESRGTNIKTAFTTEIPVMETENLCTLQCSDEFLRDYRTD